MSEERADGFECFYRERWAWALRLAYVLSGERAVAEDVTQDAFATLLARFADVEDPVNYLRASIVNGIRTQARRRERSKARLHLLRPRVLMESSPRELLDAVDQLPYREKAVVVLRFYEDLPDAVIAGIVGCKPATVRTAAARALRRLKRELSR